jgi:hypothetical protein
MMWGDIKPGVPGWYWYQHPNFTAPTIARVTRFRDGTLHVDSDIGYGAVQDLRGEWAGPITPPSREGTP